MKVFENYWGALHEKEAAAKRAAFLAKTAASSQKESAKTPRKGVGSRGGTRSGTASPMASRGGTGALLPLKSSPLSTSPLLLTILKLRH